MQRIGFCQLESESQDSGEKEYLFDIGALHQIRLQLRGKGGWRFPVSVCNSDVILFINKFFILQSEGEGAKTAKNLRSYLMYGPLRQMVQLFESSSLFYVILCRRLDDFLAILMQIQLQISYEYNAIFYSFLLRYATKRDD